MTWIRGASLALRAAVVLAVGVAVGSCRDGGLSVTGIRIVTSWSDMKIEQLEFSVRTGAGKALVAPQRRPQKANGALASGADVVVYLPDDLGGSDVICEVHGIAAGRQVGAAE